VFYVNRDEDIGSLSARLPGATDFKTHHDYVHDAIADGKIDEVHPKTLAMYRDKKLSGWWQPPELSNKLADRLPLGKPMELPLSHGHEPVIAPTDRDKNGGINNGLIDRNLPSCLTCGKQVYPRPNEYGMLEHVEPQVRTPRHTFDPDEDMKNYGHGKCNICGESGFTNRDGDAVHAATPIRHLLTRTEEAPNWGPQAEAFGLTPKNMDGYAMRDAKDMSPEQQRKFYRKES
jgi:hypothetical protein